MTNKFRWETWQCPRLPPPVAPYRPFVLVAWRRSGLGLWALLAVAMIIEYGRGLHRHDVLSMNPTKMILGRLTFRVMVSHPTVEIPKPGNSQPVLKPGAT